MNSARTSNNHAVVEEKKKEEDPNYKPKRQREEGEKEKDDEEKNPNARVVPEGREYLNQTAEHSGLIDAKRRKKEEKKGEVFGWDVFNQDSLVKAHEKRIDKIVHQDEDYQRQKEEMGDQFYLSDATSVMAGASHVPSQEG